MNIINIVDIEDEDTRNSAIEYIHGIFIRKNFTLEKCKAMIESTTKEKLPQFYVCHEDDQFIGYLCIISDTMSGTFFPFKWLAADNGDELSPTQEEQLYNFMLSECQKYNTPNLVRILKNTKKENSIKKQKTIKKDKRVKEKKSAKEEKTGEGKKSVEEEKPTKEETAEKTESE